MFNLNKANSTGGGGGLFGQGNAAGGGATANTGFNFGGSNTNSTAGSKPGGLFGSTGTSNTGTGLFGGSSNTTPGGGLFGSNTGTASTNNTGGLFGNTTNNTVGGGAVGGGLFGNKSNSLGGPSTGSLFNSNTTSTNSTGLFGSKPTGSTFGNTNGATSLFGGTQQPGGLFGSNSTANNNAGPTPTSLFGSNKNTGGGLFGSGNTGTSLFGTTNTQPGTTPFGQQPQQQATALQTISQLPITPITKVSELPPQLRQEIEQLDQYIQKQMQLSQHLKADESDHTELIRSIPRDLSYLLNKQSATVQSLAQDLKSITSIKDITDRNTVYTQQFSALLQQMLTPDGKVSSVDLDKFFQNKINLYQAKLDDYLNVLADIESAVNSIDAEVFGIGNEEAPDTQDIVALKTGLKVIIATVVEEFSLFMDTAERVAELHQKVREYSATGPKR